MPEQRHHSSTLHVTPYIRNEPGDMTRMTTRLDRWRRGWDVNPRTPEGQCLSSAITARRST
jgi:hypothetical protein